MDPLQFTKLEDRGAALLLVFSAILIPFVSPVFSGLLLLSGILLGAVRSLSQAKYVTLEFKYAHVFAFVTYGTLLCLSGYSLCESVYANMKDPQTATLYPTSIPRFFVFLPMVYSFGRLSFLGLRARLKKDHLPGFSLLFILLLLVFFFGLNFRTFEKLSILVHKFEGLPRREDFLILPVTLLVLAMLRSYHGIRKASQGLVELLPESSLTAPFASLILTISIATLTGSSPLTLIAVGPVCVSYLKLKGHSLKASVAFIAGASSLGCLFPPSFMAILYCMTVTETSAAIPMHELFRLSIPLGLSCAAAILIFAAPQRAHRPATQLGTKVSGISKKFPAIALILSAALVLTVVATGFARIEFALLFLAVLFFMHAMSVKTRPLRIFASILGPARAMNAFLPLVLITFSVTDAMALSGFQAGLMSKCEIFMSAVGFTLFWNAALLLVGALMDSVSATILFAPLLGAIATTTYGISPHLFALNFLINMELGYLIPPVATNLMLSANLFNVPQIQIYRSSTRILAVLFFALSLIAFISVVSLTGR